MDVDSDVTLVGHVWPTCVKAHANAGRASCERVADALSSLKRGGRRGECNEEGVSLRIHFDATPLGERHPQHPSMLRQRLGVRLPAQLMQELGRALNVGEEQCDRSRREIAPHGVMMATAPAKGKPPQMRRPDSRGGIFRDLRVMSRLERACACRCIPP
jgi:hypothetical protein